MIPQPLAELREKADFARNASIFTLIVGLLCAFILAHLVSILSSRPIEQISQAAQRIANGGPYDPEEIKTGRFLPKELSDLHNSFQDMVARMRKSLLQIRKLALVDTLTGLSNCESFRRQLIAKMESSDRCGGYLLFIDLDGFKAINDTHGHDTGDAALKKVAKQIRNLLDLRLKPNEFDAGSLTQRTPIAARLGGDEFAVYLPDTGLGDGSALAKRLLNAISLSMAIGDKTVRVGASIGVAKYPEHATTYSGLLKAADLAMYEAKNGGKNQVQQFTSDLKEAHDAFSRLGPELAEGFAQGQFDVHFQPVYDVQSFEIVNVEALLRWQHPRLGLLEAESFLDAAAQFGFQRKIDMFIFEQTLAVV